MRIAHIPERQDLVCVSLAGGRSIFARIENVDEDGAIYCIKTDGTADFITNTYRWDNIEGCWMVAGKDVTT